MHKQLCHEYQKCKTKVDANTAMEAIKAWWYSSGGVLEGGLKELNYWMNFWHFRFYQWGSFALEVYFLNLFIVLCLVRLNTIFIKMRVFQ